LDEKKRFLVKVLSWDFRETGIALRKREFGSPPRMHTLIESSNQAFQVLGVRLELETGDALGPG
jgi:hypothetical protein